MSNIFIISAPSGCGKTSLVRELCQTYSFLEQTVSYTTRTIRSGEVDGQDYHFISKDEFIENKKIISSSSRKMFMITFMAQLMSL